MAAGIKLLVVKDPDGTRVELLQGYRLPSTA